MSKPEWIIDNEVWGEFLGRLSGLIDSLCTHDISKQEFYDQLKQEVQQYRKKVKS